MSKETLNLIIGVFILFLAFLGALAFVGLIIRAIIVIASAPF